MAKKMSAKAIDREVARIYYANCSGMQIRMTRIPALYAMAREMMAGAASEAAIGAAMVQFVQSE